MTKNLTLLRHAKSDWDAPAARDIDRPLSRRGRNAAAKLGRYFRARALDWDLVISSPARRTRDTVHYIEDACGDSLDAVFDERLYMASGDGLLHFAQNLGDDYDRVMLVGHNPGMHDLAIALAAAGPRDMLYELHRKFPTGALAEIEFDVERWSEIAPGEGRLLGFVKPRALG